jgi:phage tail sheath protein FI
MPVTPTFPGVYIEELPSGVHTITGVATSIAAFIGWAPQGATDKATLIFSWPDYERQFGGLDSRSVLGYAVNQFFLNGGQLAYIVRLVDTATDEIAKVAFGTAPNQTVISAVNSGDWANAYKIAIKNSTASPGRFQLQVLYAPAGATPAVVESFNNLSISKSDPQGRFITDVLANNSNLVTASFLGTVTAPPGDTGATPAPLVGGAVGTVLNPNQPGFETALAASGGTTGVNLLASVDLFNLVCVPGETNTTVLGQLDAFCRDNRAFLIADAPDTTTLPSGPGFNGNNSAIYFPWLQAPDQLAGNVRVITRPAASSPESTPPRTSIAASGRHRPVQRRPWWASAASSSRSPTSKTAYSTPSPSTAFAPSARTAQWSGARAPSTATTKLARSGNTSPSGASLSSSKPVSTAAPSGLSLSPTTLPSGPRSG